jgi:hypothetical protein
MSHAAGSVALQKKWHRRGEQSKTAETRQKPNQDKEKGFVYLKHRCRVSQFRAHGLQPLT